MARPRTSAPRTPADTGRPRTGAFDRYFEISARGSTLGAETRGGLTTFFAMAYIVLLNPIILGGAADVNHVHLNSAQLTTATALSGCVTTVLMALVGRVPLALAAGLSVSAVVSVQVAPAMTWPQAMGFIVIEGLVIIVLVVTGLRETIMNAIPLPLKHAIIVGIGAFVALIGLVDAGFVSKPAVGSTPLQLGLTGHLTGWPIVVFCAGLLLMMALYARQVPGAILISIIAATVLAVVVEAVGHPTGWGLITPRLPHAVVALPDFGLFGHIDLFGGFARAGVATSLVLLFTLVLAGFFDAMGTIIGVSGEAGLVDDKGRMPRIGRALFVDGAGAVIGGTSGASANTVFIESTAGVGEGARTGVASLVTGGLLGLMLFFSPLVKVVPQQAAAPALVLIGALMMTHAKHIDWQDPEIYIPAFLMVMLMPFTYSISVGVGAGLIAYTVIKVARGKWREPGWLVWALSLVFVVYFAISAVEGLLGVKGA
ncbi:MAG TPA: NCS2 family permease [Streptosporangiaceae bacterium]|jgi:AGZA family xanthine/uracil permease-like MFS transporter